MATQAAAMPRRRMRACVWGGGLGRRPSVHHPSRPAGGEWNTMLDGRETDGRVRFEHHSARAARRGFAVEDDEIAAGASISVAVAIGDHQDAVAAAALSRLDDEVSGTGAHRVDGGVDRTVRGLYDDRRDAWLLREPVENGHAVNAGHDEIELVAKAHAARISCCPDADRIPRSRARQRAGRRAGP